MERSLSRPRILCATVGKKALAAALAVVAAVALPQVFHLLGRATGFGTELGEAFLPMHIAVLAVGLLAGAAVGTVTGALAPVLSCLLSGMPTAAVLPYMVVELAGYGLTAGLLAHTRLPSVASLLLAQIGGRAMRAVAVLLANAFGARVSLVGIVTATLAGLPGIVLQLALIPLFLFWLRTVCDDRS